MRNSEKEYRMKAVILAGGKGTRVRPLTYMLPKPMVPIVERPIMSFLLDLLKRHDFNEVIVTVGYMANTIEDHYKNGADYDMQIAYSLEGKLEEGEIVPVGLGSAGGLKKVQDYSQFFDEPFLVICGDALIDIDFTTAMEFHKKNKATATVICKEVPKDEVYKYGVVVTNENQEVLSFQEKPKVEEAKSNIINTGIYIFDPKVFDYIPEHGEFDIGGELLPLLVEKGEPFYAIAPEFQWVDVGSTKDFYEANIMLVNEEINGVKPSGKEIMPGIWAGINCDIHLNEVELIPPIYFGSSVRLEKGVTVIGPSMIGSGCIIKENATIKESVVLGYTKVSPHAKIDKKIIAGKYIINPLGNSIDIEESDISFLVDDARKEEGVLSEEQKEIMEMIQNISELATNR
ncbi:MAG: Mannose-1-phosphate guanylyltransferase (EC) [uncultured Sulfurovum sp.]|uniref:Mannose-1-phosphate guanylyltransferase (EC ) n=1 Tax=uncultured Sulfurovum sp. TaxID=269237 RepID=A0A6S6T0W0_9BACT|nr:MAG: Mannose-1-phosphate guanylyltransferase (EC) [uncultured Sulfurovum sp.]